jgi:hypothetical protein
MFGTLIYKGVKVEGEDWLQPVPTIHTPLFPTLTPVFVCPSSSQYAKENYS